jgi:hypothetical protein
MNDFDVCNCGHPWSEHLEFWEIVGLGGTGCCGEVYVEGPDKPDALKHCACEKFQLWYKDESAPQPL